MIAGIVGSVVLLWAFLRLLTRRNEAAFRRAINRRYPLEGELLPALPSASPRSEPITSELTTTKPLRAPSLEADVLTPLAQSVITALIVAICAATGCILWSWPLEVVMVAGVASLALAWAWRLGLADSLLTVVEVLVNRDVNSDGHIGEPHPVVLANPADARRSAGELSEFVQANSRKSDLLAFAHRSYVNGTSERDHGIGASSPERAKYAELRDSLFHLGLAAWKGRGPRAGWRLTLSEPEAIRIIGEHVL